MRDPQRAAWLGQLLETRRLSGAQLVLDFRLDEAAGAVREVAAFGTLRPIGVTLCLTGFDANPATLQLLQHLPVAYLKLAPKYTGAGLRDNVLREELRQIVVRAHDSDRRVIAPRIEDAQSASLLWNAGVDYLQGDFVQQAGQELSFDFNAATA